jgi:hypothetical protein
MRVLIACEYSGRVRDAFIKKGHDAMSCDLLPTDKTGPHYQGDVFDIAYDGWDLLIAHPPCTYITCSAEWAYSDLPIMIKGKPKNLDPNKLYGAARRLAREEAIQFFGRLMGLPIKKKVAENPVGVLSTRYGKPSQIIQPHDFGDDASKKTCLWLEGVEPLVVDLSKRCDGRKVEWPRGSGKIVERWSNQTDSGQSNLTPSDDRWKTRSDTYQGIADAMAESWG